MYLRRLTCCLLLAALLAVPATQAAAQSSTQKPVVAVFTLKGAISESPLATDFPLGSAGGESLHSLVKRMKQTANDDQVKAVVLLSAGASIGTAQIEELRDVMEQIKKAGKPIHVHADGLSMGGGVLLSGASELSVVPTGDIWINGIYGESPYLRGMLSMVGVTPDFTTCGDYKSAAEMFMREGPSKEAKENQEWLVDGIFATYLDLIAKGRNVTTDQVKAWIDQGVFSAERAQQAGIIDHVEHRAEFLARLKERYGEDLSLEKKYGKKKTPKIDLSSPFGLMKFYADLLAPKTTTSKGESVAIVYVEGPILPGTADSSPLPLPGTSAYSTPIAKALDEAANDDSIKAVVLRVDSPGGSAVASEIILAATRRVAAKKPFVVSMGNVAGSGGYYVACGTDTIFADRSTITGSIGVVSGKFATNSMWNKVGINWVPTQRGKNAGMLASGRMFSDSERQEMQNWMDEIYEVFKGHVVAARGERLQKDIEELAGGRVYTGDQALELGLIDKIGTLDDAIQHVAGKAGLEKYEVRVVPKPKSFLEVLLGDLDDDDSSTLSLASRPPSLLELASPYLRQLEPDRLEAVTAALQQLEVLQRENVSLSMPIYRFGK